MATARRGHDQLDRKLRILVPERRRLVALLDRNRAQWSAACAEADTWLRRAGILGGQDGLRVAQAEPQARISVRWVSSMGVSYPAEVRILRDQPEREPAWGNAALAPLHAAAQRAVEAGARLAATEEALRRLDREIRLTRRRLRALDQRWTPRLSAALHDLELELEQTEQEDGIRLRHRAGPDDRWRTP
jgi:V/A-type H+-transporting ATPase subunit D